MRRFLPISIWLPILLLALSAWSCANIGRPSGGDQDSKGAEVIGVLPYPGTLFFDYKEIVFHFDEFLKPDNYKDAVFISPVPAVDPLVVVKNKTLTVKFQGPLRENTTYVISLGTDIADFNEGNKMEKSYTYAFSTGAILDSLKFRGSVKDMWSGNPEADMKVMLFLDEAIEGDDIKGKRPEYLVATDKAGDFEFQFLAPGRYRIYGVMDENSDNRYSGATEKIALAQDPLVVLGAQDSVALVVSMVSFFQDIEGPEVKSAKWSNDYTIHVEFSEPIRSSLGADSLRLELLDTTGGNATALPLLRFPQGNRQNLYIDAILPRDKDYDLRIVNLMDSLGQRGDTTVRLSKLAQVKEEKGRWFAPVVNERRGHEFVIPAYFRLPNQLDSNHVQLLDSGGVYQEVEWTTAGMEIHCKPPKLLKPGIVYKVQLRKTFPRPDGSPIDTLVVLKVEFPNPDDFGTIAGKVLGDSTRPEATFNAIFRGNTGTGLVVHQRVPDKGTKGSSATVVNDRFEERFTAPGPFKFVYLYPGSYTMDLIDDEDGNGVLTPGSLSPYKLPEKVYHQATPLDIKAKWDTKDVEVYPIPQESKSKGVDGKKPGPKGK